MSGVNAESIKVINIIELNYKVDRITTAVENTLFINRSRNKIGDIFSIPMNLIIKMADAYIDSSSDEDTFQNYASGGGIQRRVPLSSVIEISVTLEPRKRGIPDTRDPFLSLLPYTTPDFDSGYQDTAQHSLMDLKDLNYIGTMPRTTVYQAV
ncbi:hypothetical protein GQR58_010287 [Nymphon striatum]|nr:hypothetical protein GQR58_010287 [Nymphon striatum]